MGIRALIAAGIVASRLSPGCSGADPEIADARPAQTDASLPEESGPRACEARSDCDDGVFCNGVEECIAGFCTTARNAACRDAEACSIVTCVEGVGCSYDPPAGRCGVAACLPDGTCAPPEGCTRDAECDDARACTTDVCDVATGRCFHVPDHGKCAGDGPCGVGVCVGTATESGCASKPDASKCAIDEGCVGGGPWTCAPLRATCSRDEDCSNRSFCDGVERCVGGRCVHGAIATCPASKCSVATCRVRELGDPHCIEIKLPRCAP